MGFQHLQSPKIKTDILILLTLFVGVKNNNLSKKYPFNYDIYFEIP